MAGRTWSVEGVVLGHQDLGEADRIVRLLVRGGGRVDVVARGARTSRRRFGGALDPGTRITAVLRQGRAELPWLEEVEVHGVAVRARGDLDRLVLLQHGCEVVSALAGMGEADKELQLLEVWLELLEGENAPGEGSRLAFEAKALTFAGLAPALMRCAVCQGVCTASMRFDPEAGGAVHPGCGSGAEVEGETLVELERLRRTPLAETPGMGVPTDGRWLMVHFIEHHARRELKVRVMLG